MSAEDVLIFDRVLNIVRTPGAEHFDEPLEGSHLSAVVSLNICHDIIDWWADCHEQGRFSNFSISSAEVEGPRADGYTLAPLLLDDGRAGHMVLQAHGIPAADADTEVGRPLAGVSLNEALKPDEAAKRVLDQCLELVGAQGGFLQLYPLGSSARATLVVRGAEGVEGGEQGENLLPRNGLLRLLMKNESAIGDNLLVFDSPDSLAGAVGDGALIDSWPRWPEGDALLVPLRLGGQLYGALALFNTESLESASVARIDVIETGFTTLIFSLLAAYLQASWPSVSRPMRRIRESIDAFGGSDTEQSAWQHLTSVVSDLPQIGYAAVYLLDKERLRLQASNGTMADHLELEYALNEGLVGTAGYNLQTQRSSRLDAGQARRYRLAMPMKSHAVLQGSETEVTNGVLYCESFSELLHDDEMFFLLKILITFAQIAEENARLMKRSLELLQDKSLKARQLEQKRTELNEFIHRVSHDLKNPLNNIDGYAELLAEELKEGNLESMNRYISRIRANVPLVLNLIKDLVELSRIGTIDSEVSDVDIALLLKELAYDFEHSSGEKITIRIDYASLPETVMVNRHRITEVFTNLISNAAKYSHPLRQAEVEISCSSEDEHWHFEVTDNGIGVPEEALEDIFNFGYRLKENDSAGTGAGLAICRKIIETHGGRMWAASVKDQETTVHFTLPVSR